MKKIILVLSLSVFVCFACTNKKPIEEPAPAEVEEMVVSSDSHNSENSLDWAGTYKGIVPCADCEGIETEIQLTKDGTFVLKTKYLGKESVAATEDGGNFSWDESGSVITLSGLRNRPNQFSVVEGAIVQLDMEGNVIEGELAERYILRK
ncbi:lipoprotein [Bacteroidales bacterium]|nr:lipoprotein [Bacteroidales bacterium]